jgi:putative hydrolase of the HAD superfamily
VTRAILFDLDETLVAQERAFLEAYYQAGALAAEAARVDAAEFALDLPGVAHLVFQSSPAFAAVRRCCFGGRDILWGDTSGDPVTLRRIADATPGYRTAVWRTALEQQGITDQQIAHRIRYHFSEVMLSSMAAFAEVKTTLDSLAGRVRLGIVTNEMPGAQNAKLRRLGLDWYFEVVVASASVERGKPSREIFEHALGLLHVSPEDAVMVGDSLEGDVLGAARVGIRGVWINRQRTPAEARLPGCTAELPDLTALPSLIIDGSWGKLGLKRDRGPGR